MSKIEGGVFGRLMGLFKRGQDGTNQHTEQSPVAGVIEKYQANLNQLQDSGSLNFPELYKQLETDAQAQGVALQAVVDAIYEQRNPVNELEYSNMPEIKMLGYEAIKNRWQDFASSQQRGEKQIMEWVERKTDWEFRLRKPVIDRGLDPVRYIHSLYTTFGNPTAIVYERLNQGVKSS